MRDLDKVLDNLNALEQAIVDICDIETVHAIQERKRMILKK
jgi:hypothetical protein